jgi:hypothetical protein
MHVSIPSIERTPNLRPVAAEAASSKAGVVIPVPPVNPSVEASPPLEPTPSVVNRVNPALQAKGPQAPTNEGAPTYTSVPDPVSASGSKQGAPHDWTIHRPAPEKVEQPPPKPISQVLLDHLKSMWNASASAVTVEQVNQTLTRPTPTEPTQVPGDLAKQVLTYQPTKIKKNEKI